MPDQTLRDIELRVGLMPVDELNRHRAALTEQVADLRAVYGPFGSREALRKIELARLRMLIRAELLSQGTKVSEAQVDDMAHAHEAYVAFVAKQTSEAAEWTKREARLESLESLDRRSNTMTHYARTEISL